MSLEDLDIIEKQIKDFTAIVTTKLNEDIISLKISTSAKKIVNS